MAQTNYQDNSRGLRGNRPAEPKPFPDSGMREDWRKYYKNDGAPDYHGGRSQSKPENKTDDTDRCPQPDSRQEHRGGILDSILGSIRLSGRADGDRILLLGLLLLLSGEDCDRLLLLAILYILL